MKNKILTFLFLFCFSSSILKAQPDETICPLGEDISGSRYLSKSSNSFSI